MSKLKYTFKTDTLFKLLFVKHPELLKRLIVQLLRIKLESISWFEIKNPEMPPDIIGNKFCRLDINMTVDGQQVDLEIQVENEGNYPERVLFHWSRAYSNALPAGGNFSALPRTIIISIIHFNLFDCLEFHSEFQPIEVSRHTPLTDKMVLHFFELKKLPKEIGKGDLRLLWLALFRADTEEELAKLEALEVPELNQAISAFQSVVTSPEFREIERMRTKARYDEAQALYHARREEKFEVAKRLMKKQLSIEDVADATGLNIEEVERLRDAD